MKDKKMKKPEGRSILQVMAERAFEDVESRFIVKHLRSDLAQAIKLVSCDQARYLVDLYYQIQKVRTASENQERSLVEGDEPSEIMMFFGTSCRNLEKVIKEALGSFAEEYKVGKWLQSICGIGPVLSAGLLSTFDIRDRNTASAWWRYAGLDPTIEWKKGQKRPFDARAKVLCFLVGDQFIKHQNSDNDIYGKIFAARKGIEIANNEAGLFAEQAKAKLEKYKIGKTTDAYKAYSIGKLPPAHINSRARRYAVKIFLSHFHDICWLDYYEQEPPVPYVFSTKYQGGVHRHYIDPPSFEGFNGKSLKDLYAAQKERPKKKAKANDCD